MGGGGRLWVNDGVDGVSVGDRGRVGWCGRVGLWVRLGCRGRVG